MTGAKLAARRSRDVLGSLRNRRLHAHATHEGCVA
jgi:hypothetical protein